jgi:hypothetical protein
MLSPYLICLWSLFHSTSRGLENLTSTCKKNNIFKTRYKVDEIWPSCAGDLAEWLERLTANAEVATVLISASSDKVKSEGAADEAVLNTVHKKNPKNSPV